MGGDGNAAVEFELIHPLPTGVFLSGAALPVPSTLTPDGESDLAAGSKA